MINRLQTFTTLLISVWHQGICNPIAAYDYRISQYFFCSYVSFLGSMSYNHRLFYKYAHMVLGHAWISNDDIGKWKHSPCYWTFVRGTHRSPVVPLTKAFDAELWYFLWSAPQQMVEITIETFGIWDAMALIMPSLKDVFEHVVWAMTGSLSRSRCVKVLLLVLVQVLSPHGKRLSYWSNCGCVI